MKRTFLFVIMAILAFTYSPAQRKIARKAKPAKETKENVDPRIESMTISTQKVMFIDSIVADKNTFLKEYRLNDEAGSLHRYNDFFATDKLPESYIHINEMGNKCYYSLGDTCDMKLYTSDMLDKTWTEPVELKGIYDKEKYNSLSFPFMMADGTTLYFAAKGTESIGGYDIFVTRFDSETGQYLKPENIGMPFNSEANDYMYAVDELDSIGWFVTDRNQLEGKVCIYIFIPSDTRQTYQTEAYSTEQIERFARIAKISDTWENKSIRSKALARLKSITEGKRENNNGSRMRFVINNNTIYRTSADFRSKENIQRFETLKTMTSNLNTLATALDKARKYYSKANAQERNELTEEILKSEKQYERLEMDIKQLEKDIRNSENQYYVKKE